jgi:hypothetical protein
MYAPPFIDVEVGCFSFWTSVNGQNIRVILIAFINLETLELAVLWEGTSQPGRGNWEYQTADIGRDKLNFTINYRLGFEA